MSKDHLRRFVFENADARGAIVSLDESYKELVSSRTYSDAESRLLGEFSAAVALLVSQLKFQGRLALQVRQGAAVSLIVVECNNRFEIRGTIHDADSLSKDMPFQQALAGGVLSMTVTPDDGSPYQGIVPLQGNDLASCLTEYFRQSEQLPGWFRFAVSSEKVVGFMLQALPRQVCLEDEETAENWGRLVHLAETLTAQEMLGLEGEELLHRLFHEETVRLFPPQPVTYCCHCSVERMERGLLALGSVELEEILEEQDEVTTQCHFCGKYYRFTSGEIHALLLGSGSHSSH